MPVLDGKEATRRIKATEAGAGTKIIALTAHALEEERREILAAGCDGFVRKPYRETEIFEVMARHLGLKYTYEQEGAPVGPVKELRPEQLAALPAELLSQLQQAVVLLDTERTLKVIAQIVRLDEPVGRALQTLATGLE